jgi:O-antigen ligase
VIAGSRAFELDNMEYTGWRVVRLQPMTYAAALLLVLLPWLIPFAPAPTPAVVPQLLALACTAVLLGICSRMRTPARRVQVLTGAMAWGWLLAGLVGSVIALIQYFGAADHFWPWIARGLPGEAFGNLRQRNHFATLTAVALSSLLLLSVTNRFAQNRAWLVWFAAGLLTTGNAASSSRTGLMELVLLAVLFWVWGGWGQRHLRRVCIVAALSYGVATLALPWLAGLDPATHGSFARLRMGDAICASRLTLWSNVLTLILEKPWAGWGWGELDYAHYMTLYPGARFCDILDNAHNLPLHLAVELGVPVAATVCLVLLWQVWRARPWRETDPSRQMAWAVLALIGLHSLLEYPLWYGPFQMTVGLCVYLLWVTRTGSRDRLEASRPRGEVAAVARHVFAATGLMTLAAVAYAGWDYHRVRQIYLGPAQRDPAYRENTLEKISTTHLFRGQAEFAALTLTALTPGNAQQVYDRSTELLHFSPEPRVIEKVIESAVMLGRDDDALRHLARYRAAFPQSHAKWRGTLGIAEGVAD